MQLSKIRKPLFFFFLFALTWACKKAESRSGGGSPHRNDSTQAQNVSGDTGVCIGNSIIAGHPWRSSGLELGKLDYPDSFGQISWHLTQLTKFPWIDHGWGGQTTVQIRNRFLRDAVGLSVDPGDGRGARTLSGTPTFVVLEGGINDIQNGIPLDTIETNIAWMASTCKQYNIHCIVLNCVGYGKGEYNGVGMNSIFELNKWLASGVLDSVNVTVVDINSLWNSGKYPGISPYGNDNFHYSSLVDDGDGVHFTQAGYDSVANLIFRVAKLP
jgi:lysophospholipase L1-like esterase